MAYYSMETHPCRLSRAVPWQDGLYNCWCPFKMAWSRSYIQHNFAKYNWSPALSLLHYDLPEQLVSDNGPQLMSEDFAQFMMQNGTKHVLCAPYHPSYNGLAKWFMQTFKRTMKAEERERNTINHRLSNFLFDYRCTRHATTNASPC